MAFVRRYIYKNEHVGSQPSAIITGQIWIDNVLTAERKITLEYALYTPAQMQAMVTEMMDKVVVEMSVAEQYQQWVDAQNAYADTLESG